MNSPVALITGANGGLGTTVTDTFRGSGFRVAAVARSWQDAAPPDTGLLRLEADLSTTTGAEAPVQTVLSTFGQVDALVHLVGGFAGGTTIEETSNEVWQQMIALNLWTSVAMMRAVIPSMRARQRGRIVMVGSRAALQPAPGLAAYAASKAALLAVVQVAAAELKDSGVTVNALLPSTIDSPANRKAMGDRDASRWVQPASLASLMLWLCSDAGRDVNGALIPVYGRV